MSTKEILWDNLKTLMVERYGEENLYKLHIESKDNAQISLGSLSRIKARETAVGLDVLDRLASFFNVTPAMLITKDLTPHPLDEHKKNFDTAPGNQKLLLLKMLTSLEPDRNINDALPISPASSKNYKNKSGQRPHL